MPVAVYLAASALGWPPAFQAPHTTSVVYSYWWTDRWGSEKGTRSPPHHQEHLRIHKGVAGAP